MTGLSGAILYRGPSMLDGKPIVVVATGLAKASRNEKTGDMVQTWIMRDDVDPWDAVKSGQDASVCGDCPHRGTSCYVKVFQAPKSVWKAAQRGVYPVVTDEAALAALGRGRAVRIGSYGDPAAVPAHVWGALVAEATAWTGYTHQWRSASHLQGLVMASVDTPEEKAAADREGWRTFRVRLSGEPVDARREFICPASKEEGFKTDCASCKACMGTSAKAKASPVIIAHGATARRFALYREGVAVSAAA